MTVELPLSTLSAKILSAEYGYAQPIAPGRADWLSDVVRIDRTRTRFTEEEEAVVKSCLEINVPAWLAEQIQKQGRRLGVVLHRLHLENLSRHMAACAMRFPGKGLAMAALRDFYEHYGLSDDDFSQESAYREYSRFSKKFLAKHATNNSRRVLRKSRVLQHRDPIAESINHAELDALCRVLDERLAAAHIRSVAVLARHSYMYIYAVRGGRDIGAISRRFKKHRAAVYRALAQIRERIKRDRRFARAIKPLLDPAFVLPAPEIQADICNEKGTRPRPSPRLEMGLSGHIAPRTPKNRSEAAPFSNPSLMSCVDLHAIEKACAKPAPGLSNLAFVDPRDLEVQPDWYQQPSISDLVFMSGKAAFSFGADRLTARLSDKTDTRNRSGDTIDYLLQAFVSGITPTTEYLRAKLLNRRVHIIATYQNGEQRFVPNIRLSAEGDSGDKSNKNGYSFSGIAKLDKVAPFFDGTFDVIGGPYIPPTVDPTGPGVVVVETTVTDDTFTYTIPAGKLLAFVWVRSDAGQMPQIGVTIGGSELGGPTPLVANQASIFGSGLLRPTSSTPIYFSGLAGTNQIEIWLLSAS